MGSWYSDPFVEAIYETTKQQFNIQLPAAICEEIVYYALSIVASDPDEMKFVVQGDSKKASHSDYRLDFIFDEKGKHNYNTGGGIMWQYPIQSGIWKFEMLVLVRDYAMAIGVIDTNCLGDDHGSSLKMDFEDNPGCYGYYHGGWTTNLCANTKRVYSRLENTEKGISANWTNKKVGILIDLEDHKIYIMDSGKIWWKYAGDIAQDTSYFFHFWLHKTKDNVIIYPPQRMNAEEIAEMKKSRREEDKE